MKIGLGMQTTKKGHKIFIIKDFYQRSNFNEIKRKKIIIMNKNFTYDIQIY